jgi:hypothetical protein
MLRRDGDVLRFGTAMAENSNKGRPGLAPDRSNEGRG